MKQPGNGCNYDDAESRPDCISNTDRDGFQNQRKKINFDHGTIIVREGKGSKDRALMLPESLAPSLREQLSRARAWWLKDQAEGRSGVGHCCK